MDDMRIIKIIEDQMEIELKELNYEEFNQESETYKDTRCGYLLNRDNLVTGLRIEATKTPPLNLIQQLTSLEVLILRGVSLKEISFLKKMKGLTSLDLS
jgi:hypothetical protein